LITRNGGSTFAQPLALGFYVWSKGDCRIVFIERTAFAKVHGNMASYTNFTNSGIRAFVSTSVARIGKVHDFIAVQHTVIWDACH
jgi:hypothetical protein